MTGRACAYRFGDLARRGRLPPEALQPRLCLRRRATLLFGAAGEELDRLLGRLFDEQVFAQLHQDLVGVDEAAGEESHLAKGDLRERRGQGQTNALLASVR